MGSVRYLTQPLSHCSNGLCYNPVQLHQRSSAQDSKTCVIPGQLRSAPAQPRVLRSAPLSDSIPSSIRPPWTFVLTSPLPAPFVLLAIGRVPITHKAHFLLLLLCPMKIAQAHVVKLLGI